MILSLFLHGPNPPSLRISDCLLAADALFNREAAVPLTVADDLIAPSALLYSADAATIPITQYLLSYAILYGANPATLGVSPN
jgi:hypothetical protein